MNENLKLLRERCRYTEDDICQFLSLPASEYAAVEKGDKEISMEALEKLSDLYNVDEFDIIAEKPEHLRANAVLAFKKQGDIKDLNEIAQFHRIVKNYVMMCDVLDK